MYFYGIKKHTMFTFSRSGGCFMITESETGAIVFSSNAEVQIGNVNDRIYITVRGVVGTRHVTPVGDYALNEITSIGGDPPAGTINLAIVQMNQLLPIATSDNQVIANELLTSIDDKTAQKVALNEIASKNADSLLVREYDFPLAVAQGLVAGHSWVSKSGKNQDIDTASVPEDIWGGGGVYTGFPTGAAEVLQAVSDSASDTGTLTILYLPSATATAYLTATVTLNGLTPVDFGVSGIRVHSANYSDGTATGFNVGHITVRHKVTTSNVFLYMLPNSNQTYCSAYTVPFNCTGYIYSIFSQIQDGATGTIEGCLWTRLNGTGPRLRRNFVAAQGADYNSYLGGALSFPALTDIIIRVTSASANNTIVLGGYDLLLVNN